MRAHLERIYLALIFLLLYAPIAALIVLSFNASKTGQKWGGFTLKWYSELFQNQAILQALYNTLLIAFLSAAIATLIGTMAAMGINGMNRKMKTVCMSVTNIPMLNADIVTDISLMLLFIALGVHFGFGSVLAAHITFNIPYVILSVMPKLKTDEQIHLRGSPGSGRFPLYAFFKVVFPDIVPGVLSGFLLAFTMSLDDFIITHFTKGPGLDTLSTKFIQRSRKASSRKCSAFHAAVCFCAAASSSDQYRT